MKWEIKEDFYDAVTQSSETCDFAQAAKILNFKGIGRNKLFEILRDKEILRQNNQPYQKIDSGWFGKYHFRWYIYTSNCDKNIW